MTVLRASSGAMAAAGFFLALSPLCFFSCVDSPPAIQNVRFKAVFDYLSEEGPPECYAVLFVLPASDIARVSKISLIQIQSGLVWEIEEPVALESYSGTWFGSARLAGGPAAFPQGTYLVRYTDTSEREAEVSVNLLYPQGFQESSAAQAREIIPKVSQKQIAVYDEGETLLFFGGRKKEWNVWSDIKGEIGAARFYRECYVEQGYAHVVMLPLGDIDSSEAIDIVHD